MAIFLQILGAAVLVVLLFILGIAAFFYITIRRMKRLAKMMGGPVAPIGVNLIDAPGFPWKDRADAERLKGEFLDLGFVPAGQFSIREIPSVGIAAFAHPDGTCYGVVNEHPMVGVFSEVVRAFADGTRHNVTTMAAPKHEAIPPYKTVVRVGKATAGEMMSKLDSMPQSETIDHSADRFREVFEEAYRREMTWSYTEGPSAGVDAEEIGRMIGQEPDAETAAFLRGLKLPEEYPEDRLRSRFLETSNLTAAEWEAMRDDVYFVHDELDDDDLAGMAADGIENVPAAEAAGADPFDLIEKAVGTTPRARFRELLELVKIGDKFELIATLEEPVPCDVYRLIV